MKHFPRNPRKITNEAIAALESSCAELGDLACIVHDLNSDTVPCGNQRTTAMGFEGATPVITQTFDPPTKQGTVALGYLEYAGERFAYRAVRWTPEQCRLANMRANHLGGQDDWAIIAQDFTVDELATMGIDAKLLAAMNEGAGALREMMQGDAPIDPMAEWQGMPEHNSEEIRGTAIECVVRFLSDEDRIAFQNFLGYPLQHKGKTYSVWYPQHNFDQLGKGTVIEGES